MTQRQGPIVCGQFFAAFRWAVCVACLAALPYCTIVGRAQPPDAAPPAQWSLGVAKTTITPAHAMWMSGYGSRTHAAEGKLTDLWAKAILLQDGNGQAFLVVTLDLVGIDRELSREICEQITRTHGLARHQIALCTSHTHSGPAVGQNLSSMYRAVLDDTQRQLVRDYTVFLREAILRVVGEAKHDLRPCHLAWGSGFTTFAVNRRENKEPDVPTARAEGRLRGPVDYDVPVLSARDPLGKLRAVLFGYACHATVLSGYEWCGDYPGYAHQALEERYPGCIACFWAGCGADQNPLPRRDVELAKRYGQQLADAVSQVLEGQMEPLAPQLTSQYQEIPLPLAELPTPDAIARDAMSSDRYVAARAQLLQEQLQQGPLATTYPYPIQSLRLGKSVSWILLGGEVVVDYALRFKQEHQGERTWVGAYANDVMAYIPSRRVLQEGGYEGGGAMVYYGLPAPWSPMAEEQIAAEVKRQLIQP